MGEGWWVGGVGGWWKTHGWECLAHTLSGEARNITKTPTAHGATYLEHRHFLATTNFPQPGRVVIGASGYMLPVRAIAHAVDPTRVPLCDQKVKVGMALEWAWWWALDARGWVV